MTPEWPAACLADEVYDGGRMLAELERVIAQTAMIEDRRRRTVRSSRELVTVMDGLAGETLQDRWRAFEWQVWPQWLAGVGRTGDSRWSFAVAMLVAAQAVRPSWSFLACTYTRRWVKHLPEDAPLAISAARLREAVEAVLWTSMAFRDKAQKTGLRIMMVGGYTTLEQITDEDLRAVPITVSSGSDVLDAALCSLGVLGRTPLRGAARRMRNQRLTPAELAERSRIPPRFRAVHVLYLEHYQQRISDVYATTRHKHNSLEHFWCFLDQRYPEIRNSSEIRPAHVRAFIPEAIELARSVQRGAGAGEREDRSTAMQWLTNLRCFFADVCTWGAEPGSPFEVHAPAAVPLERHDLRNLGFDKVRRRAKARSVEVVIDLEREIPKIRAVATRRWDQAQQALNQASGVRSRREGEAEAFWDWAILELLLQSGLRIEEASELTTLDVLRRRQSDGRTYYMLHVKPSKFDRARVIPIGDGLGRVIAEIIRHVKVFYGTDRVPDCDHYDSGEKRALPRAPYLLQGCRHPSPLAFAAIRSRLARLSRLAEARRADGSALVVRPHDCRRAFASEHLNNNTPIHVIQALLGHASPDTVMVYAKLYPSTLVEEYRKTVGAVYADHHGADSLRNPTSEEWTAFEASCSMRDMGTHLCALPTGEHCARGLVCLGCGHAQPKKSATPVFRSMLASHQRSLTRAHESHEPAGQIAARELEIIRIQSALHRAEQLGGDVAAAHEAAPGGGVGGAPIGPAP
jgi:integrase